MACHPVHGAVPALVQPLLQMGFDRGQIDIADAEAAETEFMRPAGDARAQV